MQKIEADRLSIGSMADVYGVLYDHTGRAYCDVTKTHQWLTGEERFNERVVPTGYVNIGDRHLGSAVKYKVPILPGEDYVTFWTRIEKERRAGEITVMGGAEVYSDKDKRILENELPQMKIEKQRIDPEALKGMSYTLQGKQIYPYGVAEGSAGQGIGIGKKMSGIAIVAIAVIFAIGYLLKGRRG